MKNIHMTFNVGPVDSSENLVGSFDFSVADPDDERQIAIALKMSIKRLGIAKNQIVLGFSEVFMGNRKIYDIDIFRIGRINKTVLKRVAE